MKSPVVFVSDTRNWRHRPSVLAQGQNGGPQLGESDVSSVPQALVSLYSGRR
jgi:hypothetical protein